MDDVTCTCTLEDRALTLYCYFIVAAVLWTTVHSLAESRLCGHQSECMNYANGDKKRECGTILFATI